MKISSASKKVLASALSAAMVVAFAPTVAFGATGSKIAVTINLDGGTADAGQITDFANATVGDTITLPTATKAGYAVDSWKVKYAGDDDFAELTDADSNVAGIQAKLSDKESVEFKAVYATPAATTAFSAASGNTAAGSSITATVAADQMNKLVQDKKYTLKVTGPTGKVLATSDKFDNTASSEVTATVTFGDSAGNVDPEFLVGGTYTTTIVDEDGNAVFTSGKKDSLGITQLDVTDTTTTPNTTASLFTEAKKSTTVLDSSSTFVDADGYSIDNAGVAKLKAGVYEVKKVAAAKAVAVTASGYNATARTLTFQTSYTVPQKGSIETAVTDPNGKVILSASDSAAGIIAGTFKQGTSSVTFAGATEAAGDYVLTATVKDKDGETIATGKGKITLSQVVYEAGEGVQFKDNSKATSGDKTDWTKSQNQSFWTSSDPSFTAIGTVAEAKDGYTLAAKWQLNGKDYDATTNPLSAGKVNTLTATAKVTDVSMNVVDPTVESASYDSEKKEWTVKVSTATAGAQIKWGTASDSVTNAYDASKGIVTKAETIYVKAFKATGSTASTITNDSNVVAMTCLTDAWSDFASTTGAIYKKVGKTSSTYAEAADVKAALEAGDAAVKAAGYKTAKDMGALIDFNAKAVYTALKAYADATLAAYDNGALVVAGDKAYTMTATALKAAKTNVADDVKDVKDSYSAAQYKAVIKNIVTHVNAALNAADEDKTVTGADVTAAKEASAALQAAKDADAAKAALEAYNKLSDAAKKLVSTADVTAAQKVVSDAEAKAALVNAQDLAAARDLNGKKVTAKAKVGKKAQGKSFTYALAASESGATASYAKVSGSKYIKVSANGKVTFSKVKVAKKAKTYKAKVSVTYGTQTVTKTVQLVVKKK